MRQALSVALQEVFGAVVLVSHDQHLLNTVADKLIVVHDGHAVRLTVISRITPAGWPPAARCASSMGA